MRAKQQKTINVNTSKRIQICCAIMKKSLSFPTAAFNRMKMKKMKRMKKKYAHYCARCNAPIQKADMHSKKNREHKKM